MTRDDDDTERRKRPGSMSDAARALVGKQHRARTPGYGVPSTAFEPDDDITSPQQLLDRDLSNSEIEIVRRSKRNSEDPATVGDVIKLAESVARYRRREKSSKEEQTEQLRELLNRPPDEATQKLADRMTEVERPMKTIKWVAALVLAGTGGMLLKTADFIATRSELQGENAIRLKHVEEAVLQLSQDFRDLIRHYQPALSWPSPQDSKP